MVVDGYRVERDRYGWTLFEQYEGRTREGEVVVKERESYYGSLKQCCLEIIDRTAGNTASAQELVEWLKACERDGVLELAT